MYSLTLFTNDFECFHNIFYATAIFLACGSRSIGNGKIIVEFFSAAIVVNVWRYLENKQWICSKIKWLIYLNCNAAGELANTSAASLRLLDALNSPSAAIIWKNNFSLWKTFSEIFLIIFILFAIFRIFKRTTSQFHDYK